MAFIDLKAELAQSIPGLSRIYAGTLVKRALQRVLDSNLWSFQLQQYGFSTPNVMTAGTISIPTPVLGGTTIIGDATATAAWLNLPFYFLPTVQQIRANGYSIYSIIAYDNGQDPVNSPNYPFATLTLDRPFIDPLPFTTDVAYQMFQAYIPAPPQFKRWLTVADMFNCWALDVWTSRRSIDIRDPARLYTSDPNYILPYGTDARPGSATFGQMLYELYPNPQTAISYQCYYVSQGPQLVNNSDTLPYPLSEDLILSQARCYAYEWAESRKDVMAAKGSGANYSNLLKEAKADHLNFLKTTRLLDKDQVDSFMVNMNDFVSSYKMPYFNAAIGRANMGI